MNRDTLSQALGEISDRHIDAAAIPTRRRHPLRRIILIAAAAVLCIALALPVMAASDAGYELLYTVMPAVAQRLKPVQLSCEDNGIVMEVVSASVEGDTAEAYIALRDLTGDRVDDTTDLFDSWYFHTPFDSMGTCRFESYDESTGTALFYVFMQTMDGEDIRADDDKITFSAGKFLSRKQDLEGVELPGVLENCSIEPKTAQRWPRGWSGLDYVLSEGDPLFLVSLDAPLCVPADGVAVTAAGYVNGKLHIQVRYEDILRTDNHGFLYLLDADGTETQCLYSESFFADDGVSSYEDYVFDVPVEVLGQYTLHGDFRTCACLTEGRWQVTFTLAAE